MSLQYSHSLSSCFWLQTLPSHWNCPLRDDQWLLISKSNNLQVSTAGPFLHSSLLSMAQYHIAFSTSQTISLTFLAPFLLVCPLVYTYFMTVFLALFYCLYVLMISLDLFLHIFTVVSSCYHKRDTHAPQNPWNHWSSRKDRTSLANSQKTIIFTMSRGITEVRNVT